jgi:hypothetical protein
VEITKTCLAAIQAELDRSRNALDHDLETGGYLGGHRFGRAIKASVATQLGNDGRRRSGAVNLGTAERVRLAADLNAMAGGVLGSWHTHPTSSIGRPSTRDLQIDLELMTTLGRDRFLTLIVTRGEGRFGWSRPVLNAWVTRRPGMGRPVCEPALVEVIG